MTQTLKPKKEYNLEERTAKFGEEIIKFCKDIMERSTGNKPHFQFNLQES